MPSVRQRPRARSCSATNEYIGVGNTGLIAQSGGTNAIGAGGALYVGHTGAGPYSPSAATTAGALLSAPNEYIGYYYGSNGGGTFTQSGGTNSIAPSGALTLGYYWIEGGTYIQSGGSLSAPTEYVGYSGYGTFTQSGGVNTITSTGSVLWLAYEYGSSGAYNLQGGMLVVPEISGGSGTAAFNFTGGTLQASDSFTTQLNISTGSAGSVATFDTNGYTIMLSGSILRLRGSGNDRDRDAPPLRNQHVHGRHHRLRGRPGFRVALRHVPDRYAHDQKRRCRTPGPLLHGRADACNYLHRFGRLPGPDDQRHGNHRHEPPSRT